MPMLSVESIEASYGQVKVLRGLSMRVPKGSVVALLGGNGAGKTTLMRAIVGLITARAGAIMLDGEPIQQLPTHKIFTRGVALVPQGRELFPEGVREPRNRHAQQFEQRQEAGIDRRNV
jgi:ABC-type branched-subunit amino acid transport system ATPase component